MWSFDGLPVHVLLVHALVVLVPAAAAAVVAAAWLPGLRRRLGPVPVGLAVLALVLTPVTAQAGEWLQDRLPQAPLIADHAELGEGLLPWVVGLAVGAVGVHLVGRRQDGGSAQVPSALRIGVAVLATALAVAATVQTVRTGESGSRAVWEGSFSETPLR